MKNENREKMKIPYDIKQIVRKLHGNEGLADLAIESVIHKILMKENLTQLNRQEKEIKQYRTLLDLSNSIDKIRPNENFEKLIFWIKLIIPGNRREEVVGDLREKYHEMRKEKLSNSVVVFVISIQCLTIFAAMLRIKFSDFSKSRKVTDSGEN